MINGMLKGEITSRRMMPAEQSGKGYCAVLTVKVKGWVDGQATEDYIVAYMPEFLRRRMDFFMKDTTKYCVIIFETMAAIPSDQPNGKPYIAVKAARIEA